MLDRAPARTSSPGPSAAARSTGTAVTPSMPWRLSVLRAPAMTCAPSSTSARVTARPMPLLAPVTTATLSVSARSIAFSLEPGESFEAAQDRAGPQLLVVEVLEQVGVQLVEREHDVGAGILLGGGQPGGGRLDRVEQV